MLFDVAKQCMIVPISEDKVGMGNFDDAKLSEEVSTASDGSHLHLAIDQLRSDNQEYCVKSPRLESNR